MKFDEHGNRIVERRVRQPRVVDRFCSRCGYAVDPNTMKHCPRCGVTVLQGSPPSYTQSKPSLAFERRTTSEKKISPLHPAVSLEKLERPLNEINEEVKSNGVTIDEVPEAVKRTLFGREHYLVKYKILEAQEGEYGNDIEDLGIDSRIVDSLEALGRGRLYKFQEEAIKEISSGQDVVITAPTGNGKTLAFAIPLLHKMARAEKENDEGNHDHKARALLVYPTKALARDQLKALKGLAAGSGTSIGIYDGDASQSDKRDILASPPDVIISNFDTVELHLRRQTPFAQLLLGISYLVVDELHTYVGSFGSHVYFILRRLKRLLGNHQLQLIGSSATIRNPKQFAEQIFGCPSVKEIRCERGRRGRIHFVILYPSKSSMYAMVARNVRLLTNAGMKTLVFANTHKNAEVLNLVFRRDGIRSEIHRAGLLKSQRTWVEEAFKNDSLRVLVATPTLELGIDIGDLDSVVSMLASITTLTQRMGRAGRKAQESVVLLALRNDDPISAFYKNHPDLYFTDINPAYVEPKNSVIARLELMAAAMDRPLSKDEFPEFREMTRDLENKGLLVADRFGKLHPTSAALKEVEQMNIRGIGKSISILDNTDPRDVREIGERQLPTALRELFPEAVYLSAGRIYECDSIEYNNKQQGVARVKRLPDSHPYKTEALRHSDPRIVKVLETRRIKEMAVSYCDLTMTEVVDGYVLKKIFSEEKVGPERMLAKPLSYTYETKGLVFKAPKSTRESSEDSLAGSFHALEHALIEGSNSITGSGSFEIGGVSMGDSGVIFVYDGSPGGSGLTKLLFDRFEEAMNRTLEILKDCKCASTDGCPMCTYSYQCGNNNDPLNKKGAIESIQQIFAGAKTPVANESDFQGSRSYL